MNLFAILVVKHSKRAGMIKNVEKLVLVMGKQFFIPFNIKTYVEQNGVLDFMDTDFTKLAVKCDGIYMGSGWGLLKIAVKDIIANYKWKLSLLFRKDDD